MVIVLPNRNCLVYSWLYYRSYIIMKRKRKKEIEGYAVVLTWRYADGSWNTETLNQDDLPDSFLDYLKEYERVENEQASEQKG